MGNSSPDAPNNSLNQKLELDQKTAPLHFTTTQDGTITFTITHFKSSYDKLTLSIDNFKNHLKIECPSELTAIIFKLKNDSESIQHEEFKGNFLSLIELSQKSLKSYYQFLNEIFSKIKINFSNNQQFILSYLNICKFEQIDIEGERINENKAIEEFSKLFSSFGKFADVIEKINSTLNYFNFGNVNLTGINTMEGLNKFYEENEEKIKGMVNFKDKAEFRKFVEIMKQLKIFFNLKNDLIGKLEVVVRNKHELIGKIMDEVEKKNDDGNIMNEFKDYFHVMLKHRFIRHIEEKFKKINQEE